jgi:hypothetical protein
LSAGKQSKEIEERENIQKAEGKGESGERTRIGRK